MVWRVLRETINGTKKLAVTALRIGGCELVGRCALSKAPRGCRKTKGEHGRHHCRQAFRTAATAETPEISSSKIAEKLRTSSTRMVVAIIVMA
jgi:hypothetical protein